MEIFFVIIILTILLFVIFSLSKNPKNKLIYCSFIAFFLYLVVILRHESVGINDTELVYLPQFRRIPDYTIIYILRNLKDPVFYVLTKIFTMFSLNERLWLSVIAFPLIFVVTRLIYVESKNCMISFLMFMSLGFYTLCSFTVLRHSIALSFTILAYFQIKEKNLKKFLIYVVLASCFHQTAIIFVFAYWISKMKVFDKKYCLFVMFFVLSIVAKGFINSIILMISEEGRYTYFNSSDNIGLSYANFFINILIMVAIDIIASKEYKLSNEYMILSRLIVIGVCLTAFMPVLGEFYRLSMFYSIYEIVLLPNSIIIQNDNRTNKNILLVVFTIMFSIYMYFFAIENAGLSDYRFFWN